MGFLRELRRRNVIRVAGLYAVSGWLIVQVAETLLPAFGIPDWVLRAIIIVLALGFLPTLIFSWAFELTPEGLKRERDVDRSQSMVDVTARKLDIAVIVLLLCVAALLLWTHLRGPAPVGSAPTKASTSEATVIADKSIAVLPFADFSQGGDQSWFADGLTEEILNSLARTPDLLVSARTSSFKYKGSTLAVPQIAKELGVAHVLEGSVRSGGERIRVTAQLIRASDGFHLWSQTYDRDAADVIGIQEDLARQIALAMQTSMDPKALADMAQVGTKSVEAYQAYLRGVVEGSKFANPSFAQRSYEYFEQARALDETFAAAHARAADYWLVQLDPSRTAAQLGLNVTPEVMRENFRTRIDLAIQHATNDYDRLMSRAMKAQHELRLRDAIALYRQILQLRPMDERSLGSLLDLLNITSQNEAMREPLDKVWTLAFERSEWANMHLNFAHRGPDRKRAADQALQMAQRWPDDAGNLYQAHRALLWDGRVTDARRVLERWKSGASESIWSILPPARQASAEGRCEEVERLLKTLDTDDIAQQWHLLMLLGRKADAEEVLMPLERSGQVEALSGFLNYPHFDATPYPSLMRILEREQVKRPPAETPPFACKPAAKEAGQ